jgi:peptidoglycan/LPS O-acetylase OafA/YrhL
METFMLIAGVTFVVQIKKYHHANFFWNRFKRLIVPLILTAAFINYPVYLLFADSGLNQHRSLLDAPRQAVIMHLWFLRDLFLLTTLATLLYFSSALAKVVSHDQIRAACKVHQVLILCSLPFLLVIPRALGYVFPIVSAMSTTYGSIENLMHYGLFFFVGILSSNMPIINNTIQNPSRKGILVALIFFSAAWTFSQLPFDTIIGKTAAFAAKQGCTLVMVALAIQSCYGFRGAVKRCVPTLDRASYSIYLLHLPLLILVANATDNVGLSIWYDFPLVFCVTLFLCLYIFRKSEQLKRSILAKPWSQLKFNWVTRVRD